MVRYSVSEGHKIETPKQITNDKNVCLRHRFEAKTGDCSLCDAKREASGKFEKARRIFVMGKR